MSEIHIAGEMRRRTPANMLAAISWTLLVAVMFGGYSLLRMLTSGAGLSDFEEQFFRAGHGHAGVLSIIGILFSSYLARTNLSYRSQVVAWSVYLAGVTIMSGGFFVHMAIGEHGESSIGTAMIPTGGVILAASVLYLVWHLFASREKETS
ncbi:MAG: hypothetical protein WKF81_01580 [Thermomicrobiales bacterium]